MSFRTAESLLKFRSQIDAMAPGRDKSNDGTIGDTSHQARPSDHNPNKDGVVTAMDITHDPRHGVDAGELAEILRLSKDPRIKYVISNRRIFSSEKSPWQWRPYNGANAHTHHVHVSVMGEKALYDDTHPWPIEPRAKVIEPPQRRPGGRLTNITATVFGGAAEFKRSAYDNHVITDDELGVALPFHFSGTRPKVRVSNPMNGASVVCDVVDMGPWNTNDPYWENGGRPQAESGTARDGRRTNLAGIDLTPAAARQLGIDDKGEVEWEFVSPAAPEHSTEFSLLGRLMQRLDHIEDAIADNARRIDPGFAARDTSSTPTPMPGLIPDFMSDLMPGQMSGSTPGSTPGSMLGSMRGSDDVTTLLERIVPLVEKLQGQGMPGGALGGMLGGMPGGMPGVTPIATPQPAQFGKALDLLKTLLAPGADGKPPGLGQVNGALGQTIGNLLNGKKTALGLLGAVGTPILSKVSETAALGPLLGALTPAIGLSGFALPIFLGLTAWGVLGKMEKWSQGTAPRPRA